MNDAMVEVSANDANMITARVANPNPAVSHEGWKMV